MENGLPRKIRKQPEKVKVSDILSFTSAIIAIVVSAIFYFAGWVYISHWYSFFGIDATELSITPQTILIHGVPGVFVIIIVGLITISSFAISKLVDKKETIALEDVPNIIMSTYSVAIIVLIVIAYLSYRKAASVNSIFELDVISFLRWLPLEAKVSFMGAILLVFVFGLTDQALALATGKGVTFFRSGGTKFEIFFLRKYIRGYLWLRLIAEHISKKEFKSLFAMLVDFNDVEKRIDSLEHEFLNTISVQQSILRKAASEAWQFWAGAFIILYFLVSISVSAIFGEWDARAGKKSMIGGWQAEATYVYSNKANLILPVDKAQTRESLIVYGPLITLGKNGDIYYFTDWEPDLPYKAKPNVYIVKISETTSLGIQIFAPTPTPTPTLFVFETATLTPTPQPNFTPIVTSTP